MVSILISKLNNRSRRKFRTTRIYINSEKLKEDRCINGQQTATQ